MKKLLRPILLLILAAASDIEGASLRLPTFGPHDIYAGPEIYYLKRSKKGGSHQSGWLYGGHATYERRPDSGFYWAVDAYYAQGEISGKTPAKKIIKSKISDSELEGRFGYSFCFECLHNLSFTPYAGVGYFRGTNRFIDPSPITCLFKKEFTYGAAGFKATIPFRDCWNIGVDFQAKYSQDPKNHVKDDPAHEDFTQIFKEEWQYELSLPVRYFMAGERRPLTLEFTPFYRSRHYGGMENYPFDFIETKYKMYGIRLMARILF